MSDHKLTLSQETTIRLLIGLCSFLAGGTGSALLLYRQVTLNTQRLTSLEIWRKERNEKDEQTLTRVRILESDMKAANVWRNDIQQDVQEIKSDLRYIRDRLIKTGRLN